MYDIKNLNIWKKEERRETNLKGFRDIDISEMNLSVRSYNCLRRANCNTVGDILDQLDEEGNGLRKIRNLGTRSEKEIKEVLEELKREYRPQSGTAPAPTLKLVKPSRRMMDWPIDDLHLSPAAYGRLKASGISFVKDLYADCLTDEPGWYAVRELFERILAE